MSYSFAGKVAIVTGAGGGLGFEYAKYLAQHGAKVVVNDLGGSTFGLDGAKNSSVAEAAAQKIRAAGGEAIANGNSVSDEKGAKAIIDQAIKKWGRVDIVINNAGIASTQVFPNVDTKEINLHLGVHVLGAVNMMKAAWPHMVKQGGGRIINTSSSSTLGFSPQISYPTMKSALFGLTRNTALLGKEQNIHVNVILPAAFTRLTNMLPPSAFREHLERDFQPERLAPVIAYLCHDSCDISGEFFTVGGGKFARLVFAETPAAEIDMSVESVASSIQGMMADRPNLSLMKTSFDDLFNLGFSEEEYSMFYNMSVTQGEPAEIENFKPVAKTSVDNVWDIVVKSPVGDQKSVLTLKSQGKTLVGNAMNAEYGMQVAEKGEIKGQTITWKTKITKPVPLTLTYTGELDADDNMQGTMKLGIFGESKFIARPVKDQQARETAQQRFQEQQANPVQKKGLIKRLLAMID
ncbi:Short-chain dehydrogenase/reductase SDR [gamma proteobacterium HdN1]|nr:Short-chain dehydrogenase/reductase SDR [gamma proteobacterium HdN1]